MNRIETLIADVESEMEAFQSVLDEYEQTLTEIDDTLEQSNLDTDAGMTLDAETTADIAPVGAD